MKTHTRPQPILWFLSAGALALALLFPVLVLAAENAPKPDKSAGLSSEAAGVLARLDRAQANIKTLTAEVVETRTLAILSRPEVLRGQMSFERPGKIRWEYSQPEKRIYVLADGHLTGWIPSKNQVEKINIRRYEERVRRMVAFGQDSKSLLKDFQITWVADNSLAGTDELSLIPKSRRLRKRIQELRFWVDRANALPRRIEYQTSDGNKVLLDFRAVTINSTLPKDTFALDVPADAHRVHGLSSLGLGFGNQDSSSNEEF